MANPLQTKDQTLIKVLDTIYPVGSLFQSSTHTTASSVDSALGGTWQQVSAGDEVAEIEVLRYWSDADKTSVDQSFSEINWSDDVEVRIQLESTGTGSIGVKFNNGATSQRGQIRGNSSVTSFGNAEDQWQCYLGVDANVSVEIIGRCVYTNSNTVNYKRWIWEEVTHKELRFAQSAMKSAANISRIQVVGESGANLKRCFISIVAKKRLGKVYRYKRTA